MKEWSEMRNRNRKANDEYVVVHDENPTSVRDEISKKITNIVDT